MSDEIRVLGRIGPDPHADGAQTPAALGCPDILETSDPEFFAVIGIRKTSELAKDLPPTIGCGPDEEIVLVPRRILVGARDSIPTS